MSKVNVAEATVPEVIRALESGFADFISHIVHVEEEDPNGKHFTCMDLDKASELFVHNDGWVMSKPAGSKYWDVIGDI